MLTVNDIDSLNTFAGHLAHVSFGGTGSVIRNSQGVVRLTLTKDDDSGDGSNVFTTFEMVSTEFETASGEITRAVRSTQDRI